MPATTWQRQFERSEIPDYPADFDERYVQCAHPALITPDHLRGDERLTLVGLVPGDDEVWSAALPGVAMEATLVCADRRVAHRPMLLDTVHIDLDAQTVSLAWRLTLDQRLCVERVHLRARSGVAT